MTGAFRQSFNLPSKTESEKEQEKRMDGQRQEGER